MNDQKSLVLLVLVGVTLALGAVYILLRSRPEAGNRTGLYRVALKAVMALVIVVLTAPFWILVWKTMFQGK